MTFVIWLNGYDHTHHSQMIWNSMTIELARFVATLNPKLVRFILHGSVHWTMKRTDHSSQLNISNKYKYIVKWRYAWIYSKCILSWYFACACFVFVYVNPKHLNIIQLLIGYKGKTKRKKKTGSNLGICIYEMDLLKSHRISIQLRRI